MRRSGPMRTGFSCNGPVEQPASQRAAAAIHAVLRVRPILLPRRKARRPRRPARPNVRRHLPLVPADGNSLPPRQSGLQTKGRGYASASNGCQAGLRLRSGLFLVGGEVRGLAGSVRDGDGRRSVDLMQGQRPAKKAEEERLPHCQREVRLAKWDSHINLFDFNILRRFQRARLPNCHFANRFWGENAFPKAEGHLLNLKQVRSQ